MIFDTLENAYLYYGLSEELKACFDFLNQIDLKEFSQRKENVTDKSFALFQMYDTKDHESPRLENHKKYIDLQYMVEGHETIEIAEANNLKVETPYQESSDICFFKDPEIKAKLNFYPGNFAVFYPNDAHKPGLQLLEGNPVAVKKIVIKILV